MKKNKHRYYKKQELNSELEEEQEAKKWFEEIVDDPKGFTPVTDQVLIELKEEAKKCHGTEVANYNIKNARTNTDYKWIKTVMSKGTASDKVAAHTVAIQDNPICGLDLLQSLVNMVKVGKKKECILVIDTLTELFLTDLLRPNQRLMAFHQHALSQINELSSGNAITRRKILSAWYFEDQLKEAYTNFVLSLNKVGHDVLDNNKEKAIGAMYKLLCGNPEQEKNLLSYIVNKLGDPSQKVASKAIYSLGQLLIKHPNMQGVVLTEVEKLLFRTNISSKTQYYGLCFLSQYYLSHETSEIGRRLIEVYFSFFKACVKKGEIDSRMMSALLMGVKRAYPYAKLEMEKITDHIDTLYRIVHIANFNNSLHALQLLYQVADHNNSVTDRFYSALYRKLFDSKLLTTTHQAMLLSLIYKALLKDSETARTKVFVKRLLQIACFTQPSFSCGILYLVSQLLGKKPHIQSFISKKLTLDNDDDDEEKYHDVKAEEDGEEEKEDIKPDVNEIRASWYHCDNLKKEKNCYDPLARNPLYAGGNLSAYTELVAMKEHFHPTVSLYANNILEGDVIKYSGDPLKDFTLIRFLDRFVYKNPKKNEDGVVQGGHPTFGKRKMYVAKGLRALPVNSAGYLNENLQNIPVDELFMYKFLRKKFEEKQANKADKDDDDGSDLESVQSEEFEEMLDKMGGKVMDDEDLDFMNDIGDKLKGKKDKRKKVDSDEESGDEIEMDEEDESDELDDSEQDEDLEMNEEDRMLLKNVDDDDDDEIIFGSDDETTKQKKKSKSDINTLFASAEEFASLLDDEGSAKRAPGGSNDFSNKDKATVKQIAWEENRNRWVQGFDKVVGKKGQSYKKRRNPNKGKPKSKKMKTT